jgi:heterodisulfide reductase subunit B
MPMDYSKYPKNWKAIATAVKEAAGWRCEVCGVKCYSPGEKVLMVQRVLTVAHINHNPADCRPENLLGACSVCHLQYDSVRRKWERLAKKRVEREARLKLFKIVD